MLVFWVLLFGNFVDFGVLLTPIMEWTIHAYTESSPIDIGLM
jgi:hypothetical protein